MGNYSSTWSLSPSLLYQGVAGKESDFFFPDQMSSEADRELPAEIWADIISFLSFPDQVTSQITPLTELTSKYLKISLSCVSRRMRKIVSQEMIAALKKYSNNQLRFSSSFEESR